MQNPLDQVKMYKRPQIRIRDPVRRLRQEDIIPGTRVYDILHPKATVTHVHQRLPVFRQNDYINLFNRYQREAGLPENTFDYLPPEPVYEASHGVREPHIEHMNWVHIVPTIQKNGKIKIKLNTGMCELYEKYYKNNKIPPVKTLMKVYKSLGFSNAYLEKIEKKLLEKPKLSKAIGLHIDKIFNKPSVPKPKKKKAEPEVEVEAEADQEVEDDEDEEEEDDDPGEDGEMDIDIEPDDLDDPAVEEEYFSDGD